MSQYEYVLQFSGSTVWSEAHKGRGVHSLKLIQMFGYPTAWPDVLKNSGHWVNFRTTFKISGISGQCPGLYLIIWPVDNWPLICCGANDLITASQVYQWFAHVLRLSPCHLLQQLNQFGLTCCYWFTQVVFETGHIMSVYVRVPPLSQHWFSMTFPWTKKMKIHDLSTIYISK